MNNHVIYKLTFPNNKVYIGQTKLKSNGGYKFKYHIENTQCQKA